jgi:uncharacterized membrane protein
MQNRKHTDLIVVAVLAVVCTLAGVFEPIDPIIRRAAAILFALVLPGYALTAALFPRPYIGGLERLTLSLCLSVAVATVGAVVLNESPTGIQAESWALLLGGVTLAASGLAWMRRLPGEPVTGHGEARWVRPESIGASALLLALAVVTTAGAMLVATTGAGLQDEPEFTQVWLLPSDRPGEVVVGVHNAEPEPIALRLELTLGDQVVGERDRIELDPGQTWEERVPVDRGPTATTPILASFYRDNFPDSPYRLVSLFAE